MAVKEWFRRLQPVQLYLVLFFTTAFFLIEMIASHVTHSLTLLLNAYHMLCNIIALVGCIASIKYSHRQSGNSHSGNSTPSSLQNSVICISGDERGSSTSLPTKNKQSRSDRRMKNTFGWARIDIVTMLVCCVFLASFCFSLLVEALQTLVHIDHMDEMHHPMPVLTIGACGILLNSFCYILIGGYTFNQGIVLHVTMNGDVILRRNVGSQEVKEGEQQLSSQTRRSPLGIPKSQGFRETCRDALGCVFVILVSLLVYFTDSGVAKYIDPLFAIISSISLFALSYSYMKESGLILLQTIPNHINIDSLKRELLEAFPGIVNVHDLHVWQLTGQKIISTVHIIFLDPTVYASISDQVTAFFIEMGITQVTIQPEFHKMRPNMEKTGCLIRCHDEYCSSSQCCSKEKSIEDSCSDSSFKKQAQSINKKFDKKEIIPASTAIDLKSFTVYDEEGCSQSFQSIENLSDGNSCQQKAEQTRSNKDNTTDSGLYAISVDVNDGNYSLCASHDESKSEIAS
ncbi:Zinc transporter 10 [Eufriesea mexicana]|uniref:Zinc transporter 10 n=2 Tax=Eufriesea mexicana TaxID=516756 RepID=A0A310SDN7_9HYME|nr:PREDICTED: zinc transporter 1 isoform X2 [Eufriesea mexicana]XP_017764498.1 PREDICTED: zinc transporter 1 isoform X2 [Eufriesea mexicana]XP_017764499.1 PREDICTED: zinc transporter 1 isoform X2 [Eufriesea mexicana]OAD52385.1 Zinc transporter 10 [Eufriesea mexicana]